MSVKQAEAKIAVEVCKSTIEEGLLTYSVEALPKDLHPILTSLNWFDKSKLEKIRQELTEAAYKHFQAALPKEVLDVIIRIQIHNKNISSSHPHEGYLRTGGRYESICIRHQHTFYWLHGGAKSAFLWLRNKLEDIISIRRKELLAERTQEDQSKSLIEVASQPAFLAAFKSYCERNPCCSLDVFWAQQCRNDAVLGVRTEQIVAEIKAGIYRFRTG